jgi:hypothetical protein
MDPHERLGPNQSAKIEAECLTTAQSKAKMQVRSGSKSLSVLWFPVALKILVIDVSYETMDPTQVGDFG